MLDGERIFIANVDDAFRRSCAVGTNYHPFDDAVRVSFQHAAVHIGSGVTLIGIAHEELATIVRLLSVDPECPTQWSGLLTSADTAQLVVGLWHVFANLNNASTGEARQVKSGSIRFEVTQTIFTTISTPISSVITSPDTPGIARFNFSGTIVSVGQSVTISGFTAGAIGYNGTQIVTLTDVGGNEFFETIEVFTLDQPTGIFSHLG